MKKKYLNIILIVIVVGIWGKLIYNYTKRFTKPTIVTIKKNELKNIVAIKKNSFDLLNLQRDPFLNKMAYKKNTSKKIKKYNTKPKNSKHFNWPRIKYIGYLSSKSSSKLAILEINGTIKNCKESTLLNENIYIRKIYRDSIKLEANSQIKIVKK